MTEETTTQKPLLTDEAAIQERQVTIRVLTIGTKQITQTLFRQLVEEDLIDDETGRLKGKIWGWVNLHVDCDAKWKHYHVVWEDNGQLKRSRVRSWPGSSGYHEEFSDEFNALAEVYLYLVALANKRFPNQIDTIILVIKGRMVTMKPPHSVKSLWELPLEIEQLEKELTEIQAKDESEFPDHNPYVRKKGRIDSLQNQLMHARTTRSNGYKKEIKHYLEKSLKKLDREFSEDMPYHNIYQEMEEIATMLNLLEQNWKQSYKAIEDAGQLFIAVSGVWK